MTSKLVDLINKLSEIYIEECRGCKERNKIKSVSDFIGLNKLDHNCNKCKKRWLTPISGLIKKFPNTYEFCNGDTNKFILLLRKNVYPYECIDNWERFDETSLPEKNLFIVNYILKILLMKTICMLKKYLKNLTLKI